VKRWLAQILINRSLDDGTALPNWVTSLIARDAGLRRSYEEQEDLIAQLQADAATCPAAETTSIPFAATQAPGRARHAAVVVGTAIAAVITISVLLNPSQVDEPRITKRDPGVEASELQASELQAALQRSEETAQKLTNHVNDVTTEFSATRPKDIGRMARGYVQEAGSIFGRSLAMLDRAGR